MWDQVSDLHAHHGNVPVEIRRLKLTEGVGEAARELPMEYALELNRLIELQMEGAVG
jgi:hypothetical protein